MRGSSGGAADAAGHGHAISGGDGGLRAHLTFADSDGGPPRIRRRLSDGSAGLASFGAGDAIRTAPRAGLRFDDPPASTGSASKSSASGHKRSRLDFDAGDAQQAATGMMDFGTAPRPAAAGSRPTHAGAAVSTGMPLRSMPRMLEALDASAHTPQGTA